MKDDNFDLQKSFVHYVPVFRLIRKYNYLSIARNGSLFVRINNDDDFPLAENNNIFHPFNTDIEVAVKDWTKSFMSRYP